MIGGESIDDKHTTIEVGENHPAYTEISPNKRYIRFEELISQTGNIKFSYKAFDTRNGTEVIWQKICMSDLSESEQERISRSANYLKEIQHQHIMEYLAIWLTEEPRTLNLITTYLDSLHQFIGKIATLRWRIVKKWCKHILRGLSYLHSSDPQIIHRNLTWNNIFVNPGVGDLYIGGMWLSGILTDSADPISVSDALSEHYQGSAAYKAPETMEKQPLTTKTDVYSFGMCVLVMIVRTEPYADCHGDSKRISRRAKNGILPKELRRVQNSLAIDFISSCLQVNPEARLSADALLEHHFLQLSEEFDDKEVIVAPPSTDCDDTQSDDGMVTEMPFPSEPMVRSDGRPALIGQQRQNHVDCENKDFLTGRDGTRACVEGSLSLDPVTEGSDRRSATLPLHTYQCPSATNVCVSDPTPSSQTFALQETYSTDGSDVVDEPHQDSQQNCLDKQLAALSKGEDVLRDKGIHDGRRSESRDTMKNRTTVADRALHMSKHTMQDAPPTFSTMSPCGTPTTIRAVPHSLPSATDTSSASLEVAVQLRIAEGHTSDGIIKDVEFSFHTARDDFNVVATEMKEELGLTLPTEKLASLIRLQVESVVNSGMSGAGAGHRGAARSVTGTNIAACTVPANQCYGDIADDNVAAAIENSVVQQKIMPAAPTEVPVLAGAESAAAQAHSAVAAASDTSDQSQHWSAKTSHLINETDIQRSVASLPSSKPSGDGNSPPDTLMSAPVSEVDIGPSVFGRSPSSSSLASQDGCVTVTYLSSDETAATAFTIRPPADDASQQEILDYEEYVKEHEKIEKECRAARRVFEQRIQKHKIIQETCEEDLLKVKDDYSNQCIHLDKSEAKAIQKKEEYTMKAHAEFEQKIELLKITRREQRNAHKLQEKRRLKMLNPSVYTGDHGPPDGSSSAAYVEWSHRQTTNSTQS